MKFKVSVEKRLYATGAVEVDCDNHEQAVEMIQSQIDKDELQTSSILWDEANYEDCSFTTTGDVEDIDE